MLAFYAQTSKQGDEVKAKSDNPNYSSPLYLTGLYGMLAKPKLNSILDNTDLAHHHI